MIQEGLEDLGIGMAEQERREILFTRALHSLRPAFAPVF
jgi:hypothetical protein